MEDDRKKITGLYDESFEKDSCGFGLIANIDNNPSHWLINTAITALERLAHRGAVGADGTSGDGCGILLVATKHKRKECLSFRTLGL